MGFTNNKWLESFPNTLITHLPQCESDHNSIAVSCFKEEEEESNTGPHPFRFEAMWLDNENCSEIIRNGCQPW